MKNKLSIMAIGLTTFAMTSCGGGEKGNYGPADTTATPVAIENIMTRVSVRQYTGQAISDDTLDILLKAAMAAPSAINKQPWEFVVLKDQANATSSEMHESE